jgi:hypothetical protein
MGVTGADNEWNVFKGRDNVLDMCMYEFKRNLGEFK